MLVGVTGATGFLGRRVVARLSASGHTVLRLHRDGAETDGLSVHAPSSDLRAGLADVDALVIVGAADTRSDDPDAVESLVHGNVVVPGRLMAAALGGRCRRVILVGTSWQASSGAGYDPFDLYAASKEAAAVIATHYAKRGMSVAQVQLFDTYGPSDPRRKILTLLLRAGLTGETLQMSPGHQRLRLAHIEDVARALLLALENLAGAAPGVQRYVVDPGEAVALRELVAMLDRLGLPINVEFGARPYRDGEIMDPASSLPLVPGWSTEWSLEQGMAQCIAAARADWG